MATTHTVELKRADDMPITVADLPGILAAHGRWLRGETGGTRASLAGANLAWASLAGADLSGANLAGASLAQANLAGADLSGANLSRADLSGADLAGANLAQVNLAGASLAGADLAGANLAWASLAWADLSGIEIPIVPNIDAAILADLEDGFHLRQYAWHTCRTTHCRAGHAIRLAGAAGKLLEDKLGSCVAGALIYTASRPGKPVPDFYASNKVALADIRACAAEQTGGMS